MALSTHSRGQGLRTARAWAVHLYTALGNIAAFLALIAITERRPRDVFLALAVSVIIDGTDGALARRWEITRWTPTFDGRKLDDITDYLTYVFIPAFFAYEFGIVTGPWVWVLGMVLLASAFGFCQDWAKTEDGFFTGFPSYWNVVIFYMYVLQLAPAVNGLVLALLAVLVFVPIKYVYPSKTKQLRWLTLTLSGFWGLTLLGLLWTFAQPQPLLLGLSFLFPVYYFGLSFYLHFRPRRA